MKNKAAAPETHSAAQLRTKNDWRRRQAALPFARKVEIVISLQKLTVEIGSVMGRKPVGVAIAFREMPEKDVVSKQKFEAFEPGLRKESLVHFDIPGSVKFRSSII
jgi:hypothetical protein